MVPVKGAMLTCNSWIGLMYLKAAAKPKWEGKFSRDVLSRPSSNTHTDLASGAYQHMT